MLESSLMPTIMSPARVAAIGAAVVVGGILGGYALHEHSSAKNLAAQNAQTTATLTATRQQVSDLTSKVNQLVASEQAQQAPAAPAARAERRVSARPSPARRLREDPRWKKMQAQLDAQGKEIDQTRSDLTDTQGDLTNTRTQLTGSIAHTHDELVLLEKKGQRNFTEFDIVKSKEFHREGPFEIRLRKADSKHQFADMQMLVDDRNLTQKHVNLYQPVMFYTPDSPQPVEVVINEIDKNHIHGYVSAPKYRQSDLAAMEAANQNAAGQTQGADGASAVNEPPTRQKLPVPQP
jgi:hypothetical protein